MEQRDLFFGLGVTSGGAAVVGSGAFSSMQAERGVSVEVVGDDAAYLELEPAEGPNGKYASTSVNESHERQVSGEYEPLMGGCIGPNSRRDLENVFQVTNQITEQVWMRIGFDPKHILLLFTETLPADSESLVVADSNEPLSIRTIISPDEDASDRGERLDPLKYPVFADASDETGSALPSVVELNARPGVPFDAIAVRELLVEYPPFVIDGMAVGRALFAPNPVDGDERMGPADGDGKPEVVA